MTKILYVLLFFISTLTAQMFHYSKIECSTGASKICQNFNCILKAYSRNYSTMSYSCNFTRELNKMYYEQANFVKFTNNYRQIVNIPKTELCEMLKSFDKHPLFRHLVPIAQKVAPNLVHQCPFSYIGLTNYSHDPENFKFQFIPSGDYKNVYRLSDDEDEKIFELITYGKMTHRKGGF